MGEWWERRTGVDRRATAAGQVESSSYDRFHGEAFQNARERVLARQGGRCFNCGLSDDAHADRDDLFGDGLHVHHIEPASSFDSPRDAHRDSNLVALCADCHRQAERGDIEL